MGKIIHYGLVLMTIAVISAGILGFADIKTKDTIANINIKMEKAAMKEVMQKVKKFDKSKEKKSGNFKFIPGYNSNNSLEGYAVKVVTPGYGGDIVFMLGIDLSGNIVGLKVISSSETPGLGANINKKKWQKHWVGKNRNYKFNKSVDAFAGATISPRAVYRGISEALAAFEKIK
ncbi:RnfABCDGE type electron transport complex subunit G [Haliovirga abyssi]|uniref:Ion-translocating oxidoreductase complex subunit G n=1 Tax=Haliovirga abyssi TaxID=2996794 RepID=A0AAU9DBQ5_9FUSO|nr:RnfABCDGE type electron transport complex subunit G [Haliovirga abyssi]BDU49697.1 electron transport complex subunit G [Haliovirga abyssi]